MFHCAKPIWLSEQYQADEYMEAVETLYLDQLPQTACLRIAADSDYSVYIGGRLAAFGQYANYPTHRFYDEVDILPFLQVGENSLSALCWYYGINSSTYRCGTPFLQYEIEVDGQILLSTDSNTQVRPAAQYIPHLDRRISPQLGLTYACDLTAQGESFHDAVNMEIGDPDWNIRPVEKLVLEPRCSVQYTQQGIFSIPHYSSIADAYPEKDMQSAFLSFRPLSTLSGIKKAARQQNEASPYTFVFDSDQAGSGIYWIVDLGAETAGFLDLDLEVPADCDLLVGFGEHLQDGRCRTAVRNFSCTLRLKAGRNRYMNSFRRFGCRYLQFFLFSKSVTVYYSGLRPTVYPVQRKQFRSGNLLRDTIYEVCQNTLLHCMHEHYEDCPWREQALYAMDSRNQMLCGYYAFSETRFPRASLELISYGLRDDGLLSLCYPAGTDLPIPSFSLVWFIAMREYIEHTGDTTLAQERFHVLERLIDTFHQNRDENGLVQSFHSDQCRYWNFYEWSPTMDGSKSPATPSAEAPLNAFYCLALDSLATICDRLNKPSDHYRQRADAIRKLLAKQFYCAERGLFRSFLDCHTDSYSVLTNALCLLCGAADDLDTSTIEAVLSGNADGFDDCFPDTLSMQTFRFDALLRVNREKYAPIILSEIDRTCLYMLRNGATTFWETIKGEADFLEAGSLCHGWSALPIYYYETLLK